MTHDPLREALEAERAELIAKNEAATSWGAAVGARHERIKEIDRALALTASAPKGEPCAYADWGQIVQCLLRTMDHPHKGENSTEQAVRMATELCRKYPAAPPAARWDEVMSNCEDFLADIVGGAQVTERSVQHAKELREGIAALRREAPAPSGVAVGQDEQPITEDDGSGDVLPLGWKPPSRPDAGGGVRVDRAKLAEWADDFEAAAYDVPRGIKATILMTRAQEVRAALSTPSDAGNAGAEARLREALIALYEWYDRDGSVGGASAVFEAHRKTLSTAGGDEAKKSEGGTSPSNETMGGTGDDCSVGKCGVWPPEGADRQKHGLNDISQKQVVTAGETATPSGPTADRREIVAIKPLVWSQKPPPGHEHEPFVYWAAGVGGHYRAERGGMLWMAHDAFVWEQYQTQKAAKEAAQADYEKAILAALGGR